MSDRMSRVNELIRTTLAKAIPEILELGPGQLITITRVITSRDLAHAKVLVTCYPDTEKKELLSRAQHKAHELKHELSQETLLQRVPSLHFFPDETEEHAQHIEEVLDSLQRK